MFFEEFTNQELYSSESVGLRAYLTDGNFINDLPTEVWNQKKQEFLEQGINFIDSIGEIARINPYFGAVIFKDLILGIPIESEDNFLTMLYDGYFVGAMLHSGLWNYQNPINQSGFELIKSHYPQTKELFINTFGKRVLSNWAGHWLEFSLWILTRDEADGEDK